MPKVSGTADLEGPQYTSQVYSWDGLEIKRFSIHSFKVILLATQWFGFESTKFIMCTC